jgi:FMN-dependent NADH-azoreductase
VALDTQGIECDPCDERTIAIEARLRTTLDIDAILAYRQKQLRLHVKHSVRGFLRFRSGRKRCNQKGATMAILLYIESSPRKERAHSIDVAQRFLDTYKQANPADTVENLNLWGTSLPAFDGATIDAKYRIMHGENHTDSEAAAWNGVVDRFNHFNSADKYLISLPMWNFGVPYKLKHYIDVITQPGLSFSFSPETGYSGLVTGKPATVIYARGGEYTSSEAVAGMDFQKPYLEMWLRFIGFTKIDSIVVEPTLSDPSEVEKFKKKALDQASAMAGKF